MVAEITGAAHETRKPEPRFVAEEVWAVARAFLDQAIDMDVTRGRNAYNECCHCGGSVYWNDDPGKIEHKPACLVLIARDLLTGAT